MLRKLVILGVFAGASASVPILYQQNQDNIHGAVRSVMEEREVAPEPQRPLVVVQQVRAEPVRASLSGRQVRIEGDERGHFLGGFRLNGRSVDALVDTGATLVAINRTMARRIGIHLTAADFRYEVTTANGKAAAASATIDRLQVGRIDVADVEAVVLEDKALDDTLIGMSFLNRLKGFRVENGDLVLEQ